MEDILRLGRRALFLPSLVTGSLRIAEMVEWRASSHPRSLPRSRLMAAAASMNGIDTGRSVIAQYPRRKGSCHTCFVLEKKPCEGGYPGQLDQRSFNKLCSASYRYHRDVTSDRPSPT